MSTDPDGTKDRPRRSPRAASSPPGAPSRPARTSSPSSREAILAECEITTFRASGPGGQHRNRRESGVRIRHLPTGLVVTATERRSQHQNRAVAIERLIRRLAALRRRRKRRRPTRPTTASRERRLQEKRERSNVKRSRVRIADEDS